MKKAEILAPCGSREAVYAAVSAGCDSIYTGVGSFNARAYADNFNLENIKEIIEFCHLRGVKVYITFNILYKEKELKPVYETAKELYRLGADAFIVADIGIFDLFRKNFKDISISASTQMTVHNSDMALWIKRLGADRIVAARELTLEDIKRIYVRLGGKPDLEGFVHGALCVCYSGRCLFSSFIGGRSGNRGQCAQPCRMEYSLLKDGREIYKGALLSPKDIMTCQMVGELMKAGISAFKIEGRMKSPLYVRQTVKTYRKYVELAFENDRDRATDETDVKELAQVFSRGGDFSEGYYKRRKGPKMMTDDVKHSGRQIGRVVSADKKGVEIVFDEDIHCGDGIVIQGGTQGTNISKEIRKGVKTRFGLKGKKGDKVFLSYDKRLSDRLESENKREVRRRKIFGSVRAVLGMPLCLEFKTEEGITVRCEGGSPFKAEKSPTDREEIIKRLGKTGNTPFEAVISVEEFDKNIYVPAGMLNELRRQTCRELERKINAAALREPVTAELKEINIEKADKTCLSCEVTDFGQLRAALDSPVKRIYINDRSLICKALGKGKEIYFALPKIIREDELKKIHKIIEELNRTEIDGYLIRNFSFYDTNKKIHCDHNLGVFNSLTVCRLMEDFDSVTLSTELTAAELKTLCGKSTEVVAYGRLPLMVTEQCPVGNFDGEGGAFCGNRGLKTGYSLKDRAGRVYPLVRNCKECFCEILSCEPVFAMARPNDIRGLDPEFFRLIFTTETEKETAELIRLHYEGLCLKRPVDNIKGHNLKGVK